MGVFIPIAVTWIGLATAAWVYRSADNAGTLGGESFLQGWERGFGELPAGLTFDWFATYTCVLVTLLVAATAVLLRHGWRADRAEADVRRQLTEGLVAAHLVLAPYGLPAEQRAARELNVAADKVAALVGAFDAATGKMTASASVVGVAADKMTATAGAFDMATGAMTATADKVTATAAAVDTAAGKMTATAGAFDTATGAMTATADKVTATAAAVDTAAGKMTATAGAFDTATGAMTAAAGKVAAAVDVLPTAVTALRSAVTAVGTELAALHQVTTAMGGLKDSLDATGSASNRIAAAFTDGSDAVRDFLTRANVAAADTASRMELASDILGKAQQTIDKLPGTINTLAQEVTDLSAQLTNLADVTNAISELRASLDRVRTSLEASLPIRHSASQSPPPQSPPLLRRTGIFKAFRKRGTSTGG